jgi:hypothetical protein
MHLLIGARQFVIAGKFVKFQELGVIKNVVLSLRSRGKEPSVTDATLSSSGKMASKHPSYSLPPATQFVSTHGFVLYWVSCDVIYSDGGL